MNQHVPGPRGIAVAQLNTAEDAQVEAAVTVGVHLRILPAGVETIDGRNYMRATLLISPGEKQGNASSGRAALNVDLADWPRQIEKMLFDPALGEAEGRSRSGLRIDFAPADDKLASCPSITTHPGQAPIPVLRAGKIARSQREADLVVINDLWAKLLKSGDGAFAELAKEISAEPDQSSAQKLLDRLDPKLPWPAAGPAAAAGQPAPTTAPDVVNAARNVLGVMLPMERARSLKDRLQKLVKTTALRPPETSLAYLPSDPYDLSEPWPSFLGEPPLLRQLAQAVDQTQNDAGLLFTQSHKQKVREAEKTTAGNVADAVSDASVAKRLERLLKERKIASQPLSGQQDIESMSAALNRELDRHVLTTTRSVEDISCRKEELDKDGKPVGLNEKCAESHPDLLKKFALSRVIRQRFAALQTQPTLARLFNLACDVLIPWDTVADAVSQVTPAGNARYVLVTIGKGAEARMWITTKFVLDRPDAWPCTTDEVLIQLAKPRINGVSIEDGSVEQLDGFLPLAAKSETNNQTTYRYEIVTIDVERAAEQRIAAEASRHEDPNNPAATEKPKRVESLDDSDRNRLLTLRTAGFAIADRQRAIDVTRAIRRSRSRSGQARKDCIVGAEDLTLGYRLDVGVSDTSSAVSVWHPLCNRTIRFGHPGATDFTSQRTIEDILARLEPDPLRRARLDAATIAPATRLDSKDNNDEAPITAHVEDQIARWLGQPLGVDTDVDPGYVLQGSATWNSDVLIKFDQTGALPLSQTFSLAEPARWRELQTNRQPAKPIEPWKSLPLRFGARYSFQMRVVLSGGVVRPINATTLPVHVLPPKPPSDELAGFRFRRHERIEKPVICTPETFLKEPFDQVDDGLRETGGSAIVRSFANRLTPESRPRPRTVRLFAPPPVALEFAELHQHKSAFGDNPEIVSYRRAVKPGVVTHHSGDKVTVSALAWQGPRDGLRDLRYSHSAGGFPVFSFERDTKGELQLTGSTLEPWRKRNGDAVCIPMSKDGQRAEPYYPDPAAEFMVFGLRDLAGQFTDDPPVVVRLRKSDEPATACRPVAVEIVAPKPRGPSDRTRIWTGNGEAPLRSVKPDHSPELGAPRYMDGSGNLATVNPAGAAITVSRVRVSLAPGEQFRLEAWCIPDAETLGKLFEVVNGLAMLGPSNDDHCKVEQVAAVAEPGVLAIASPRPCSPAHRPPTQEEVKRAAERCFHELCRGPLPELVATAKVELTHALDKPFEPAAAPDIKLIRLSTAQITNALLTTPVSEKEGIDQPHPEDASTWFDLPSFFGKDSDDQPLRVIPGSTEVLVSGNLTVDRTVTGFVETEAMGPCLISGRFDDITRKRTRNEVLRGAWPVDPAFVESTTNKPPGKTILSIYGFDVDGDGRVTHSLEKATLLRLDDAPLLGSRRLANLEGPDRKGRLLALQDATRSYRQLQAMARHGQKEPDPLLPRASYPSLIPDTLARVMTIEVVAGSRTSTFFRRPETDAVYTGEDATTRSAPSRRIAIPSTAAPAVAVPVSIVPSFRLVSTVIPTDARRGRDPLSELKVIVTRHIRLRIRLKRPWFSSGIGERLGIVLWPPDLALHGPGDRVTDGDSVLRDYDVDFWTLHDMSRMALRALEDNTMPPEWAFVTRWGLDPIRRRETRHPWLVPPNALPAIRALETKWHDLTFAPPGTNWDVLGDFQQMPSDPASLTPELDRDVVYVGRAQVPFPDPAENRAIDNPKDDSTEETVAVPVPAENKARPDQREVGTFGQSQYFSAALLTLRPRFDLDQECWYCDLDIDPKGASYPFVRLGLVRYQPLAPSKLQVSTPVMEWAQIPPRREVVMSRSRLNPRAVMIEVRGPGAHLAVQAPPNSVFSWLEQSALKVTLCWRHADGREEIARLGKWDGGKLTDIYTDHPAFSPYAAFDFIPQTQLEWEAYLSIGEYTSDPGRFEPLKRRTALRRTDTDAASDVGDIVWRGTFVLDRAPVPQTDGSWLVAHVEEVEPMLPASYPEEPHEERDPERVKAQRIEVSGPKFAASVNFKI